MSFFLDFNLPKSLISTQPSQNREDDKIMIFENNKLIEDNFFNIIKHLKSGDVIVVNNSKVFKARMTIKCPIRGISSELLLINQESEFIWTAMIKKAKKFKIGTYIEFSNGVKAKIEEILEDGLRRLSFSEPFHAKDADSIGQVPLPPYIIDERKNRGEDLYTDIDEDRYQTLFAKYYGSVAAPTASLRFSDAIIQKLNEKGIIFKEITLHVGIGTFKPMDTTLEEFKMHSEFISVDQATVDFLLKAKQNKQRIIAAGTTVCRALESTKGKAFEGWTDIFIKPGYKFQIIDGLITNFHLPQSTLLLLVQAFIGIEQTKFLYQKAITNQYRFFSYGDGMLLFK